MLQQYIDDVVPIVIAGVTQKKFIVDIMLSSPKYKFPILAKTPSCKGSCCLLYIIFCIMPRPYREQLHHLPGKIFIGMLLFVLLII